MEKNDGEYASTISEDRWNELVKETDLLTLSPSQRSDRILELIRKYEPDISIYDLWCFAVHILQSLLVEYPQIKISIFKLNNLIYILHYRLKVWKQL